MGIVNEAYAQGLGTRAEPAKLFELDQIFGSVVSSLIALASIALFIMLVIGGFKYLTSQGDPKNVESARNTLTYAIGGMVLIGLSFLILKFIEFFTGAKITEFKIFQP